MRSGYFASNHVEAAAGGGLSDDFDRADSATLGALWVEGQGADPNQNFGIVSNEAAPSVEWADMWTDYATETDTTNCFTQIDHNQLGDLIILKICGGVGNNSGYQLRRHPWYNGIILLFRNGTEVAYGSGPNNDDPATFRIEHDGAGTVSVFRDASLIFTYVDGTPLTGKIVGFGGKGGNGTGTQWRANNWSAGDL